MGRSIAGSERLGVRAEGREDHLLRQRLCGRLSFAARQLLGSTTRLESRLILHGCFYPVSVSPALGCASVDFGLKRSRPVFYRSATAAVYRQDFVTEELE